MERVVRRALGVGAALWSPSKDAMRAAGTGNRRRRMFIRCVLGVLFFCFLSLSAFAQQPTIRFVNNPDPAPAFQLAGLDGKTVSVGDYHGKVVVLNFWATWCGPCRAEVSDLVELQKRYKDQLQVIGLVVDDDDQDAIKKFAAEFGINYPVAIASDEVRIQYGGIAALPTSFILDAEGRVVQKHEGLRDPVLYEVEIRSLLGLPIGNIRVETFEDKGQIFLKHADRASELPGVDLSKLTPEQKTAALRKFNTEMCTCGCGYTLAQCRVLDRNCSVSKEATAKILAVLTGGKGAAAAADTPTTGKDSVPEKPHE